MSSPWTRTVAVLLLLLGMAAGQTDELADAKRLAQQKHYADALAKIEQVLEREPRNLDARIEYASVLSWAGRYGEAIGQYETVLATDPSNREAALGRARVLYWSGRLDQAAAALRGMDSPEARILLAEVERARGHNDRALAALAGAGSEGATLRRGIRQELRPVLRLGYSLEDDRELPDPGLASTIRMARYAAAVDFSVHPDIRMQLETVITRGSSSSAGASIYGPDAVAVATMAKVKLRPTPWLELNLGLGGGSMGGAQGGLTIDTSRGYHFLYLVHPVVRWKGLRLDFAATRGLGDYTPLAIHNQVIESRQTLAISYSWRRLRAGGEYWHAGYSLQPPDRMGLRNYQTSANGGAVFLTPVLYRGEKLVVEAGARFEAYGFGSSAALIPAPGFFTPRNYQQYGATGHVWWHPQRYVEFDVTGFVGAKKFFLFDNSGAHGFNMTSSVLARMTFDLGRVQPFVSYGYSSAQSAAVGAAANYRVHAFGAGVNIRF